MRLTAISSQPGYFASEDGHIYSTRSRWGVSTPRLMKEQPTHDGYLRVRVSRNAHGRTRSLAVAVLVAEAFHGPRPTTTAQVRHLNGDNQDNRSSNLRYGTAKENAADRDLHGNTRRGVLNNKVRHSDAQVQAAVARVAASETPASVARSLGVSQSTISRWVRGEARREAIADLANRELQVPA